jgi:single-strand DNA-binding protein
MANNLNIVALSGNLTRDSELRETKSGTPVCNLGIAVNRSRKQDDGSYQDDVSFFDLTVWGNYGSLVAKKLKKGDPIALTGRLEQQRWENDNGEKRSKVIVVVDQIDGAGMYRTKDEENELEASLSESPADATPAASDAAPAAEPTTDDIPF